MSGVAEAGVIGGAVVFAYIDQYLAAYAKALPSREISLHMPYYDRSDQPTEVGIHVWHSTIPIKIWQMSVIYLMRIVLSLLS